MLSLFRTNQLLTSILLVFYILILRLSVFVDLFGDNLFSWNPSGEGLLGHLLYSWIGSHTLAAQLIAVFLLVVQGFLINSIVIGHRLSNESNLFPGVFYVLGCCSMPDFLYLSPVLIGNTFILIVLIELYSIYKEASSADHIFNVGFWTGIASLFYFPFIFFFIFINAGLNILRAFSLRERLILLIGLVMPFFLSWLYYYVIGKPDYFWETQFSVNLSFLSIGGEIVGWQDYVKSGLFVLAIVIVLFNSGSYIFKRNIQSQKNISILYWIMVSSLIGALFQSNLAFEHLIMLSIPLGVFLAFTFTNMKSTMAEALHFLILIIVLALQWLPWLF